MKGGDRECLNAESAEERPTNSRVSPTKVSVISAVKKSNWLMNRNQKRRKSEILFLHVLIYGALK